MATTTARNKNDVDNMNVRDRLWDSLDYSYGKKREESDKSFAKAYSQAANQQIRNGMQRSSYGAQTLANINKEKIDAQNDIYDQQIADYENRLYQIERDEKADDQWERQFGETQKQNEWTRNYQESRAAAADAQWEKEYAENLRQFNENMAFQKERANVSDTQWEKEYQEKLRQFNEQMAENKRQFDLEYGLKAGASGGSSGGGGYGGNGGNNGNNNTNNGNGGTGLSWIDTASMLTTNAKNKATSAAQDAAKVLSAALDTYSYAQQAAKDKKNTVSYEVANKKQSTAKKVTQSKK